MNKAFIHHNEVGDKNIDIVV